MKKKVDEKKKGFGKKISSEKKEKDAPEKYFAKAIDLYTSFHKHHFKDNEGYALAPDWKGPKRGKEFRSLKLLLQTLRQISEGKGFEWTEEEMKKSFESFLEKSYNHSLVRKNFLVAMMNRYKFDILSSSYNPQIAKKIREWFYFEFKEYTVVPDKDREASEIIAAFLKQQFVLANKEFTEDAAISSWRTIMKEIKSDQFWSVKPLKSIANNLQEFVNKIKLKQNGNYNSRGVKKTPIITNKQIGDFGNL